MRGSQIHRNRPLEDVSVAYKPVGFIADDLAPKIMVQHESDDYYVYSKDTLSLPETIRANGAESNRATFNLSTSSYRLTEHSLHDDVTDRDRANADPAIKVEIDTTEDLTRKILLRREVDLQGVLQTLTNFGNTLSLTSTLAWSANTTASNPITVLDSASSVILNSAQVIPNVLGINDAQFKALKEHTSILERIKYTSPDSVTEGMLAKLFTVGRVVVGRGAYNTADEGIAPTMTSIWTDTAMLLYANPSMGLKQVTGVATLWSKAFGSPYITKKWREEKLSADRIEVSAMYQHKPIATDCVYLIANTNQ